MILDGRFGPYGGFYVSELLIPALEEMESGWLAARDDPEFRGELARLLRDYAGRPTPLYESAWLSRAAGCRVVLKREDLVHGGAHKTNNTIGQGLLARRLGKRRLIAETGAGQHGVATAMAGALLGMEVEIFMGAKDVARQAPNVRRMEMFGARVQAVTGGSRSLKDAINEALRAWTESLADTFYVFGTVAGPHPFPTMVRDLQRVIGDEARAQCQERYARLPDEVVACVGGGSNALGIFTAFVGDPAVRLVGVEPGGEGISTGRHGAPLGHGRPGAVHGSYSYLLQDRWGQVEEAHSISAGLDYPGVGPEHSYLRDTGRATYVSVTDDEALDAFQAVCRGDGILPALESSHAIAHVLRTAGVRDADDLVLVNLSGRGDKDLEHVTAALAVRSARRGSAPSARSVPAEEALPWSPPAATAQDADRLRRVLSARRPAFMPFLVIGDPSVATTDDLSDVLVSAGADLLEFGFPFSDPPADGPVIQAADMRALAGGATPDACFALLRRVRARHPDVPIALLVYLNLVLQRGVDRFYDDCARTGVDAVLIADLPLEHAGDVLIAAERSGVAPVFVASAVSSDARLEAIARAARGYVYVVARVGTTGARAESPADDLQRTIARLRRVTALPLLAGFGLSTPEHARAAVDAGADGVIVGSAIIRHIDEHLDDPSSISSSVGRFAREISIALRSNS